MTSHIIYIRVILEYTKMIKLFFLNKKVTPKKDFFDLNSKEKVKIIRKSDREANELQLGLVKKYNLAFNEK